MNTKKAEIKSKENVLVVPVNPFLSKNITDKINQKKGM